MVLIEGGVQWQAECGNGCSVKDRSNQIYMCVHAHNYHLLKEDPVP
jgi:hypothetical protein